MLKRLVAVPVASLTLLWTTSALADQVPTLKTIAIQDGSTVRAFDDWVEVLANAANSTFDGDGTTTPCDAADLDCPVSGGVGRDLYEFAWTYDPTSGPGTGNVYLYLERYGSSSSTMQFYFVADTDGPAELVNGVAYLDPGDRVIHVTYKGSGIDTNGGVEVCNYVPTSAACTAALSPAQKATFCDPLNSKTTQRVDGFDLAGAMGSTCTTIVQPANGGDRDPSSPLEGRRFEARVPWSQLSSTGPVPVYWHVIVNNSNSGSLAGDDNLGNVSDNLGSFGGTEVGITPIAQFGGGPSPGDAQYGFVVYATGLGSAPISFWGASLLGLALELYHDEDGDGDPLTGTQTLMGIDANGDGDFVDALDSLVSAFDANADDLPDTVTALSNGSTYAVSVRVLFPEGYDGLTEVTEFYALSETGGISRALATSSINDVVLQADLERSGVPGGASVVPFPFTVSNFSGATDTVNLAGSDLAGDDGPFTFQGFFVDTNCDGTADGTAPFTLLDDDASDADSTVDVGPLAHGATACVVAHVLIPASAAAGDLDRMRVVGSLGHDVLASDTIVFTTRVRPQLEVAPATYGSDGTPLPVAPGQTRSFAFIVTNSGTTAASYGACLAYPGGETPYVMRLFTDPDQDGSPSDGALLALVDSTTEACGGGAQITATVPTLAAYGGSTGLILQLVVPVGAALGELHHHSVRVDPAGLNVSGTVTTRTNKLGIFADAGYTRPANVFAACDTVYVRAQGLDLASNTTNYQLQVSDGTTTQCLPGPVAATDTSCAAPAPCGATYVVSDARGDVSQSYALPAGRPAGAWSATLYDTGTCGDTTENVTLAFTVERAGSVSTPSLNYATFIGGNDGANDVSFSAIVANGNVSAAYATSTVRYALVTNDGTQYWTGSAWAAFTSLAATRTGDVALAALAAGDSVVVSADLANVAFPDAAATFKLKLDWVLSCGDVVATATDATLTSQACSADGDGDGCGNCTDAAPRNADADADTDGYAAGCDCDDAKSTVNPGATEVCDAANVDEDCDGVADDADPSVDPATHVTLYGDGDGDAYGTTASTVLRCDAGGGYVAASGDCNDANAAVNPGAAEICDASNVDEDCDTLADDADTGATGTSTFYLDADSDGYGSATSTAARCDAGGGYIATSGDCDDANVAVNPGVAEICDVGDVDEDCDSLADDADPGVTSTTTFYRDADNDGFGTTSDTLARCTAPVGYVADSSDCDDAVTTCTTDCTTDLDADTTVDCADTCVDVDQDGWGSAGGAGDSCLGADCDDANDECDADCTDADNDNACVGHDCDETSATCATGCVTSYVDGDGDGFGLGSSALVSCVAPGGRVSVGGDCDDANPNCDSTCVDADSDGYCSNHDCNDVNMTVRPGASEDCTDGLDNDCDGDVDAADSACPPTPCDGVPGSGKVFDACGVCDGDGSSCAGCDGVPYSGKVFDLCGVCDGDNSACACDPLVAGSCGGGSCQSIPGGGVCECAPGFDPTAHCGECLPGFFGATCTPCPGGAANACNGHGACDDGLAGAGTCSCATGFTGAACDACASGYAGPACASCSGTVDACGVCDGDGSSCTCAPSDPSACSGDGTCVDLGSGVGACTCDVGFAGGDCSSCAPGYFGPSCTACPGGAGGECSGHGTCDDGATGAGTCDCDPGFAGAACDACAAGYYGPACGPCAAGQCPGEPSCTTQGGVLDVCGVCNGDGTTCLGCDGVIDSGTVFDVCGVCGGNGSTCIGCDGDGDGVCAPADCNDANAAVRPTTVEACTGGVDDDCDGLVDGADAIDCPSGCADADSDGYPALSCGGSDCDDANNAVNGGAAELCGDALDNDCDGLADAADVGDCGAACVAPDAIGAPCDHDEDDDGVSDEDEALGKDGLADTGDETDPFDADSDGDSIGDGLELGSGASALDTDGDGAIDALDTDSDGDGTSDFEEGVRDLDADGVGDWRDTDDDGDGIDTSDEHDDAALFGDDVDGDTIPNWLDRDSDGDGVDDVTEGRGDEDGDGIPNYLDANDNDGPSADPDGDGASTEDELATGTNPLDPDDGVIDPPPTDSDGDGVPDDAEASGDSDGDGLLDINDPDDDGDDVPTSVEIERGGFLDDVDGDGTPNWLDTDSDGDGSTDGNEGAGDSDADGLADLVDPNDSDGPNADADGDGVSNLVEALIGTNPYDADSDGDGITDGDELGGDLDNPLNTDGDERPDAVDTDSDDDGTPDAEEGTGDDDGDGIPNYRDGHVDTDDVDDDKPAPVYVLRGCTCQGTESSEVALYAMLALALAPWWRRRRAADGARSAG